MTWLEALILGVIQGLTEFLPVSSSGHIEMGKAILGIGDLGEENLLFTVVLHFATALSTVVIFRKDILKILNGLISGERSAVLFSAYIILSMIPAAFVGLFFEDAIDKLFTGNLMLVGGALMLTGILLRFSDSVSKGGEALSVKNAVIIGIAQAIAILPGISRSGATIATAVLLKVDRSEAARFSFLMVVPLIFGKMAKDVLSGDLTTQTAMGAQYIIGFVAAFGSGLLACKAMIALVKQSKLTYFAIYCALVGAIALVYSFLA